MSILLKLDYCLFVCLFVCLLVCLFVGLFVCWFVGLLVCWFVVCHCIKVIGHKKIHIKSR